MLKVTRLADYAVLIISSFIGQEKDIVSAQKIIKKTGLQNATVMKLLSILVKKNILEAFRGAQGGYKLKKNLENISIKELIEAIEGPVSLTDCLGSNKNNCNLFDVCITKNTWSIVNSAIKDTLENIKIKDISNNNVSLRDQRQLLKI